jgi:hypothetical protein
VRRHVLVRVLGRIIENIPVLFDNVTVLRRVVQLSWVNAGELGRRWWYPTGFSRVSVYSFIHLSVYLGWGGEGVGVGAKSRCWKHPRWGLINEHEILQTPIFVGWERALRIFERGWALTLVTFSINWAHHECGRDAKWLPLLADFDGTVGLPERCGMMESG